jgi:hypothetical protein
MAVRSLAVNQHVNGMDEDELRTRNEASPSKGGQVHSTGLQPARQANRIPGSLAIPCFSARARLESPHPAWNQIAG